MADSLISTYKDGYKIGNHQSEYYLIMKRYDLDVLLRPIVQDGLWQVWWQGVLTDHWETETGIKDEKYGLEL